MERSGALTDHAEAGEQTLEREVEVRGAGKNTKGSHLADAIRCTTNRRCACRRSACPGASESTRRVEQSDIVPSFTPSRLLSRCSQEVLSPFKFCRAKVHTYRINPAALFILQRQEQRRDLRFLSRAVSTRDSLSPPPVPRGPSNFSTVSM